MRTTFDKGRKTSCAVFVRDVEDGLMIECPKCQQHQVVPSALLINRRAYMCDNNKCGYEIFYPGWEEW